jgi:hypothetical protein
VEIDRKDFPVFFRMLLSLLVFVLCVYLILSPTISPDATKWAFGTLGVILGYWLK